MQTKLRLLILAVIVIFARTQAQELDCIVKVNFESVPIGNKDLLVNFESDVRDYVTTYRWTTDNLTVKTQCTFNINIQSVVGQERYSAQVFIGSSRPIYNGSQNSAVLRLFDEAWEFTYVKGRPIIHNINTFNDLASFLDFYAYLILGYDYDTYDNLNGNPHFQKAADIASLARSSGGKGWQPAKSGYSRPQLIEEILNAKFAPVRSASFIYHFSGLDSMATSSARAYKNIVDALMMIGEVKRTADARNQIIKAFFDVKHEELAKLFVGYSDPKIYLELAAIDPSHQTIYEEYRKQRR
jgi:hypothetical protein